MKYLIPVLMLLSADLTYARKFALVVGGSAKDNSSRDKKTPRFHEFGQASARVAKGLESKGYEVTTLFDSVGIEAESNKAAVKWTEDHQKFKSLNAKSASKQNILNALEKISREAKPGDEFEFNLFAHGFRSCEGDLGGMNGLSVSPELRKNKVAGCKHVIDLPDPVTGEPVRIETSIIKKHLEELDKKGVKTNLNLASCHSGSAQELFSGLKNTCTTYLASANNVGLGCFPSDKDGDNSFTSTIDMVMASHWINIANELAKDPYFQSDRCLGVSRDHYKKNGINGSSRYDLYMSAREHDKNPHEPTISSLRGHNYFTEGNFSAVLANAQSGTADKLECLPNVEARIDEILKFGGELAGVQLRQELKSKMKLLEQQMDEYNLIIAEQIKEVGKGEKRTEVLVPMDTSKTVETDKSEVVVDSNNAPSTEDIQLDFGGIEMPKEAPKDRLKYYIEKTMAKAEEVMAIERDIVATVNEKILRPRLDEEDPCLRQ